MVRTTITSSGAWLRELDASTARESESVIEAPVEVPALTVLYHSDLSRLGERTLLTPLATGRKIAISRRTPDFTPIYGGTSRPLADPYMSRQPIWLLSRPGGGIRLDVAAQSGAVRVEGREVSDRIDFSLEQVRHGTVILLARRILLLLHLVDPQPPTEQASLDLVGQSPQMVELREEIRRVAALSIPVLVRGPTGSGKELVAGAIHRHSPRRDGPYICVNMAAIPPGLAAAELFGAVKGAFTGSDRHRSGFFQRAHGGTLFLDEIGETPREVQPLLLRALDAQEIQPVGSDRVQKVEVRILAATDLDLEKAVTDQRFLEPLIHRLAGYEIFLPPLCERRQDISLLLVHFLRQLLAAGHPDLLELATPRARPWLPASLMERLVAHPWPGNVRQLRNLAQRLTVAFGDDREIPRGPRLERVMRPILGPSPKEGDPQETTLATRTKPSEIDEALLRETLRRHRYSLKPTAEALGISRTSLYQLIEKYPGIRGASTLDAAEIRDGLERCSGDVETLAMKLEVSKQGLLQRMRELKIR